MPTPRAAAALVLGRYGSIRQKQEVRLCLRDPHPAVRLRAAQGLLSAGDRRAIAPLLEMLGKGPLPWAEKAEDILLRLAGDTAPVALYPKFDKNIPDLPKGGTVNMGGYMTKSNYYNYPKTPQPQYQSTNLTLALARDQFRAGWVTGSPRGALRVTDLRQWEENRSLGCLHGSEWSRWNSFAA